MLCLSNRKSFLSHITCVGDIFWHSCFSLAYLRRFFKTRKGKKEGSNCNLSFLSLSSFNRRTKTFHILLSHSLHLCNQSKIHQGNLFRYPVHYMRTSCQWLSQRSHPCKKKNTVHQQLMKCIEPFCFDCFILSLKFLIVRTVFILALSCF